MNKTNVPGFKSPVMQSILLTDGCYIPQYDFSKPLYHLSAMDYTSTYDRHNLGILLNLAAANVWALSDDVLREQSRFDTDQNLYWLSQMLGASLGVFLGSAVDVADSLKTNPTFYEISDSLNSCLEKSAIYYGPEGKPHHEVFGGLEGQLDLNAAIINIQMSIAQDCAVNIAMVMVVLEYFHLANEQSMVALIQAVGIEHAEIVKGYAKGEIKALDFLKGSFKQINKTQLN